MATMLIVCFVLLNSLIAGVSGNHLSSGGCQTSQSITTSATLQSPSYPNSRPPFPCRSIRHQFTSPAGTTMTITCPQFDIESPFFYRRWWRTYRDDPYLWTSIDNVRRAGTTFPTLTTTSNSLTVYFYSYFNWYSRYSWYYNFFSNSNRPRFLVNCNIQVNGGTTTTTTTTTTTPANRCDCGSRPLPTTRIVNGMNAQPGEYPYMVSLQDTPGNHICGGSLISPEWVLTAAQCRVMPGWTAVLGEQQLSVQSPNQVTTQIATVINHPQYNFISNENDVAVVRLQNAVTYTNYIQAICLPDPFTTRTFDGEVLTATGWGQTSELNPAASDILQTVDLNVISNTNCRAAGGIFATRIFDSSICALTNGQDTCGGDSGGPLALLQTRFYVIGATSFGEGCARNGRPGVYVRISDPTILQWVKTNAGITCTAPSP